ncbi:MAG: hypothetical protein HOW73_00300 [Polyangiaceae bacterium]|nr:hypothetical protein [Polyangiaceae bacterium]
MKAHPFTLLAVACTSAACSSFVLTEPASPPLTTVSDAPPGYALACVLRGSIVGALLTIVVRDNGTVVGATEGPGHFCWFAGEGRHEVTVDGPSDADPIAFDARAGERIHLELSVRIGQDEIVRASAERAAELEAETRYSVIDEGPEDEALPAGIPSVRGKPASR